MRHFGRARHNGASALSCLVGIDAALHAPGNRRAQDAAQDLMHANSTTDHVHKDRRHHFGIDDQDNDGKQNIKDGHERCHNLRHIGDTVHAANHHDAYEYRHHSTNCYGADIKGVGKRSRNAVALHWRQKQATSQHRNDGKQHTEPFAVQTFFNVISRTTAELALVLLFVNLRQSSLGESRTSTQEGNDPHPDDGTWAAIADSRGHAHDVTCTHASRQGHGESLKRGDARLLALVRREKQFGHLTQTAHLHEARADGEIQARQEANRHQCRTPHPAADRIYDLFHCICRFEGSKIGIFDAKPTKPAKSYLVKQASKSRFKASVSMCCPMKTSFCMRSP